MDPEGTVDSQMTASFVESHLDEIAKQVDVSYRAHYPESAANAFASSTVRSWAKQEIQPLLRVLRGEEPPIRDHTLYAGDMIREGNDLFRPIANYVEAQLFFARVIVQVIWVHVDEYLSEFEVMFASLESAVLKLIGANMNAFVEHNLVPGSLTATWGQAGMGPRKAPIAAIPEKPQPQDTRDRFGLSAREMEVLALIIDGKTIGETAAFLHIAQNTVKNHLKSIYAKLQVSNRAELVRRVIDERVLG